MSKNLCPECHYSRAWTIRRNKRKCKRCRKEFSATSYPIKGFRITEAAWKVAIEIFLKERTIHRIAEECNCSHYLAERIAMYLREIMHSNRVVMMNGPIEIDETYIGGQRKNKRLHIRRIKAKKGHGTDKLPIVGFFDRSTRKIAVYVEPKKLDIAFIIKILKMYVKPGAEVYTDGFKMYRRITTYGFIHQYVDHDDGEYVRGKIHTNNIEGFWGLLKRRLGCIGGMRRQYLHLFVGEIVWKFNHRNLTFKDQMDKLWRVMLDE